MQAPKSYVVRSIGLRKIVECNYNVNVSPQQEKEFYIKQADCPYFRLIRNITGISTRFNPYVVFVDIDYHQDLATIITHLVVEGIRIRGVRFVLGERSASMVRQGVLSFVDASIAPELDKRITMGLDIGETVLSKWQAYRGLVLSSCHCIENYLPKIIVVPDYETVIPNQAIKHLCDIQQTLTNDEGQTFNWTQKGIAESVRDITINAFDGVGIMHESIAAEFERITKSTTHITTCIFRAPFIKGCLHVMDYEGFLTERGVETITDIWGQQHSVHEPMIILTKSMYKGFSYFKKNKDITDWERYWDAFKKYDRCLAIARANFTEDEENVYTRCNYQILQTLDLPYEEFRHLADDSIEWITRIVGGDELYTKCFLGLTAGKVKALNDYVAAIAKNDAMMQEPNVRHYLTTLIAKYLDEMKAGKLYIKSCFKFLAPDMIGFLEHLGGLPVRGCMEADEFWTKGKGLTYDGEYLITRNPHICKSENIVLRACKSELLQKWCGHLTNVCMVNIKSITPQKLNGADFDGDLVLVIDDELMLKGVNRNLKSVIDVDDKITAAVEADIVQNRIACILRTTKSMIGEFSNYASAYLNRMPRDEEVKQKYDDYINIISVINGKSIDWMCSRAAQ